MAFRIDNKIYIRIRPSPLSLTFSTDLLSQAMRNVEENNLKEIQGRHGTTEKVEPTTAVELDVDTTPRTMSFTSRLGLGRFLSLLCFA